MRDYAKELKGRIAFIQARLQEAGAKGIVFGNSGGKDSALVGILCKKACANTTGILMPCQSKRNYEEDMTDGLAVAKQFDIAIMTVDLTQAKEALVQQLGTLAPMAMANVNPRLRMTALYAIAQDRNCLVAGTGNRSERYMGYFTKWGDGACDFNPIGDLTVTEIYEFLRFLGAPASIIEKAPSAGLIEGQTDESEMGVTYAAIDRYLLTGEAEPGDLRRIQKYHGRSGHKRKLPPVYPEE